MNKHLAGDLKVALFIRDNQPCWFSKIVEGVPELTSDQISRFLDTLFDWGIIYGEYGETAAGKAGRLLMMDSVAIHLLNGVEYRERKLCCKYHDACRNYSINKTVCITKGMTICADYRSKNEEMQYYEIEYGDTVPTGRKKLVIISCATCPVKCGNGSISGVGATGMSRFVNPNCPLEDDG